MRNELKFMMLSLFCYLCISFTQVQIDIEDTSPKTLQKLPIEILTSTG